MNTIDIFILDETMPKELILLANRLGFKIFTNGICPEKKVNFFKWRDGKLSWVRDATVEILPLNFFQQFETHKNRNYSIKNEPFARAIGSRNRLVDGYILDSTMGLGKDSILLKSFGFKTLGIERSPFCFFMLCASFLEAGQVFFDYPILNCDFELFSMLGTSKMTPNPGGQNLLFNGKETKNFLLEDLIEEFGYPNVVYFDPMYTQRNTKALPSKEMQVFREVLPPNTEDEINKFIHLGLSITKDRVVLKRSIKARILKNKNYEMSFKGKSTRYDVYLSR